MTAPAAPLRPSARDAASVGLGALWFGLLAAPLAWSAQLMVDYALIAHACFPDAAMRDVPILASARTIVLAVSALAILAAVAGIVVATRSYGRAGGHHESDRQQFHDAPIPEGRARFMALAGVLASSLFLGGIVIHALGIVMLSPCK